MTRSASAVAAAALMLLCGCVTGLRPRFPQNVQTSFVRDDMRHLTTHSLELYYPAHFRTQALQVAARVEACVSALRARAIEPEDDARLRVMLTSADFNNAYVQPQGPGTPQVMVLPEHVTLEIFNWFGLGPGEVADIGCHEAVHYVQLQQVSGFWEVINVLTGGVFQPNVLTETWFLEGLATYYEGEFDQQVGRPHSPLWRSWFASGVAGDLADLDPGYLNPANRLLLPFGGNYLTGSHFVAWLARRYGEEKLWALIERQGDSIFSSLGVTLRFERVYGHDIAELFNEFATDYVTSLARRERPPRQQVIADEVGYLARMAASSGGVIATISADRDEVVKLTVREPNGSIRFSKPLTRLLPFRPYVLADPSLVSGLDFTKDGGSLFFMSADLTAEGSYTTQLLRFDTKTGALVEKWSGFTGLGGGLTPDDSAYVYVAVEGATANLARFDLKTRQRTLLTRFTGRNSLGPPSVSPGGRRIAFPFWTGEGFDLHLLEENGLIREVTQDGRFNYAPRWLDDETILFVRATGTAPLLQTQAFTYDLRSQQLQRVSNVPWALLDPMPLSGGRLAFLNRASWSWSLDVAPLTAHQAEPLPQQVSPDRPRGDPTAEVEVLDDRPYSSLDGLLVPRLHTPTGFFLGSTLGTSQLQVAGGLALQGSDWLGHHGYLISANAQKVGQRGPGLQLQYLTTKLAPWVLFASASRQPRLDETTLTGTLSASRTFWTTPVEFGLIATRLNRLDGPEAAEVLEAQFVGPSVAASYFAGDSTPYGGLQRAFGFSGEAAFYPEAASSSFNLGDLRATVSGAVPLPFSNRHNLTFSARGRYLPGAPEELLRVGGFANPLAYSTPDTNRPFADSPRDLPGGFVFAEPLRGYEDFAFRATAVAIGSASYRYRFIIDEGWASFLWILPSFFIRQAEVEAWGTIAQSDGTVERHAAAGGALFLRTVFGQALPVTLFYQFANRFHEGLPPLHTAGVAFE